MNNSQLYVTKLDLQRLRHVIADTEGPGHRASARLDLVRSELARRRVVASDEVPGDVITLNSCVRLFDLQTAEAFTCTLVLPQAADIAQFRLSVLSPVGLALLGHRVGDNIEWPGPAGIQRLLVAMVLYQPEAVGDYSLPET